MRRCSTALCGLALALGWQVAHAGPGDGTAAPDAAVASQAEQRGVALRVHDGPTCITAQPLLDRVALERPIVDVESVGIDVTGRGDGVQFVITTGSGTASRRFDFAGMTCETRLRVLGLAIALALEALVVDETHAPVQPAAPLHVAPTAKARPAADEPVAGPRVSTAPTRPTSPTPARRPTWSLAIAPVAVFGAFPVPAGGGQLQPRLSGRRWTVRLALGAVVSPVAYLGTGRFRAASWAATPDACARLGMGLATMRLCGGIELGVVWARGRGYAEPRKTVAPHVAPTVALEVAAPIADTVALVAGAGLAVPVLRTRFVAGDLVASGWPVVVRVLAGISVDLARKPGSRAKKAAR